MQAPSIPNWPQYTAAKRLSITPTAATRQAQIAFCHLQYAVYHGNEAAKYRSEHYGDEAVRYGTEHGQESRRAAEELSDSMAEDKANANFTMNKLILLALSSGVLAACAGPAADSRNAGAPLLQVPANETFVFRNRAVDFTHDSDDPQAEAARIGALERVLQSNQMCQKGYAITARRVIVQMGEKDEVDYEGRCNH
jgi:hypothetical protein